MKVTRNQKYTALSIAFAVLFFIAYQYYGESKGGHRSNADLTSFVLFGIGLYLLSATVVIARSYYSNSRFKSVDESELATSLKTIATLRQKDEPIIASLVVTKAEAKEIDTNQEFRFDPKRVPLPLRRSDLVNFYLKGAEFPFSSAIVAKIDGYNQRIICRVDRKTIENKSV